MIYQKATINTDIRYGYALSACSSNPEFHFHDHYEIYLFLSGNANVFVNELSYSLERGDLLFFNSNDLHKAINYTDDAYERYCIHFNPDALSIYCTEQTDLLACFKQSSSKKIHLSENELTKIVSKLEHMRAIQKNSAYGTDVLLVNTLVSLLIKTNVLARQYHDAPSSQSPTITNLLTYINTHIQEDLSLEQLSEVCNIEKCYLCKLFKTATGSTIWQYIVAKRIALSKQLLSQKNSSIQDVCFDSGFNSYAHFSRTFKSIVGMSARDYQKNISSILQQ